MGENLRILKPYLRGLPIIIAAMAIAYLCAAKYLNYVTPMYESTTKLRMADINEGVLNSNLYKDLDVFVSTNKIATEIEVLKSQVLLEKGLDALNFNTEIYRVGEIRTVELYDESPLMLWAEDIPEEFYDRRFDLQLLESGRYSLRYPDQQTVHARIGDTLALPQGRLAICYNDKLISQRPLLKVADRYQFQFLSRQTLVNKVQKDLDIMAVDKDVAVVRINYKSNNPKKAALLANKLAEVYIQDYVEARYKAAKVTVDFLEEQIALVSGKLANAEDRIQSYRNQQAITNIGQETETDLRKISQLKIQQVNLKMSLQAIEELEAYVKDGQERFLDLAPNFEAFTDLLSTEIIKNIKQLQAEKKDLLLTYTPQEESVQVIDRKIADLTAYLIESITNTRKNLETKYRLLSTAIEEAEKTFASVPEKEKMLTIMNREFNIYQQSYNFLNEKRIEAEIARAAKIAFHRVITPATTPKNPISPNKPIIKIVSALLGMFVAIAFIFVVHHLKAKVNDAHTIEENSLIPIAALTPRLRNHAEIKQHFQKMAAQLEIKELVKNGEMLCLSSFKANEGATFNGYQLALALARQERKVLLIDVANLMELSEKAAGEIDCTMQLVHVIHLADERFTHFSQDKLKAYLKKQCLPYDICLVVNETLGSQMSLLFMAAARVNLVTLDARLTPAKRILEMDLLQQEYKLSGVYFLLNRQGYNPTIWREILVCIVQQLRRLQPKRKLLWS